MKIEWNRKYTTIAVYAVLVVIASLVCYNVLHNFNSYKAAFHKLIDILLPVIYGFSIAFVLDPVTRFFEKKVLPKISSFAYLPCSGFGNRYFFVGGYSTGYGEYCRNYIEPFYLFGEGE